MNPLETFLKDVRDIHATGAATDKARVDALDVSALAPVRDALEEALGMKFTGERDKDKEAKVATARNLWVPAVNNAGLWGRWTFIEIADALDAANTIHDFLEIKGAHA